MNKNVDINLLAKKNVPVLFADTCILLDVIRDVTRDSVIKNDVDSGLHLLSEAEKGINLFVLIAPQVRTELIDNEGIVESESKNSLDKFIERITKVDTISSLYGASDNISLEHLKDHVDRAKSFLDRWKNIVYLVPQDESVLVRAFKRVTLSTAPAKKGKDSMKDCVVTETYLDAAKALRNAGLTAPLVFASSNTKDYCEGKNLADGLVDDFKNYNILYSPNFGSAKYNLGL